jgi:hypothetical protein
MKPGGCNRRDQLGNRDHGLEGAARLFRHQGAINAFTKALAMSLIDKGIRVNAVAPVRSGRRSIPPTTA